MDAYAAAPQQRDQAHMVAAAAAAAKQGESPEVS